MSDLYPRAWSSTSAWLVLFFTVCIWVVTWDCQQSGLPPYLRQTSKNNAFHRRRLQQTRTYNVELFLALYYLDDSLASLFEARDTNNEAISHFCMAVNEQASGNQVIFASQPFGATFETKVLNGNAGFPDYQCSIVDTNRVYDNDGEDLLGQGYFILEVTIEQLVHVISDTALSQEQVTTIVKTGFERGDGGRVKFRSLLKRNPTFASILDLVVLNSGLSPPQAAPTYSPTQVPTEIPSAPPSISPSRVPSIAPSRRPSHQPSIAPSSKPSVTQTLSPSGASPAPTKADNQSPGAAQTPTNSSDSDRDRRPLILGAIAGGVATILVSCFFIFCIWFPFCRQKDDESNAASSTNSRQRKRSRGSGQSSPSTKQEVSVIPGVVSLGGDNESLADTTLGDQTAGGFKKQYPPKKKRLVDLGEKVMSDSFDENSLYTSGRPEADSDAKDNNKAQTSGQQSLASNASSMILPPSLSRTLDFEEDLVFPTSESATDSSVEDVTRLFSTGSRQTNTSGPVDVDEGPVDVDAMCLVDDDDSTENEFGPQDGSFPTVETVESDEEKAKQVSRTMEAGTKGYDPFAEDTSGSSSFGFDSEVHRDGSFGSFAGIQADDRSSPSSASSKTKKIQNLLLECLPGAEEGQRLLDPTDEEKREVDEEVRDGAASTESEVQESPVRHRKDDSMDEARSPGDRANNALLRSVLEEARILAEAKSSANRSRASRKSEPPRVSSKGARSRRQFDTTYDILADIHDLEEAKSLSSSRSFKSVGARPRSRKSAKNRTTDTKARSEEEKMTESKTRIDKTASSMTEEETSNGTHLLGNGASLMPNDYFVPGEASDTSKIGNGLPSTYQTDAVVGARTEQGESPSSPSSSELSPSPSPAGTLGAKPRDKTLHGYDELPETPTSSPGVLGIASQPTEIKILEGDSSSEDSVSNPWLFDNVEKALGPRSVAADMESISGRSARSGRSYKSGRSARSHRSRRSATSRKGKPSSYRSEASPKTPKGSKRLSRSVASPDRNELISRNRSAGSPSSHHASPSSSSSSKASPGEQKSASEDIGIAPRKLEHDLRRLEMQLSEFLQTEPDQMTTSSLAASSAGVSRSTLSSKHHSTKRSKKRRIVVVVPPGKLGIILANRHDGKGTVVSEVRPSSSLLGMLSPGDKVVAVDGQDVTGMVVSEITSLMSSKSEKERRLTVIKSSSTLMGVDSQEMKVDDS